MIPEGARAFGEYAMRIIAPKAPGKKSGQMASVLNFC